MSVHLYTRESAHLTPHVAKVGVMLVSSCSVLSRDSVSPSDLWFREFRR